MVRADDHVTFVYGNIGSPLMAAPMILKEFAIFSIYLLKFDSLPLESEFDFLEHDLYKLIEV